MFLASIVSQEPTLLSTVAPDDLSSGGPHGPLPASADFSARIGSDRFKDYRNLFSKGASGGEDGSDGRHRANVAVRWNHVTATFGIARWHPLPSLLGSSQEKERMFSFTS